MKAVILGSGVIGVTTAYFLHKQGYEVTVIDRQSQSAMECSHANGGQLSYCQAEPWASPSSLINAIKWIGKKDAPLLFRFRYDLEMWLWTLKFIRNCTPSRVKKGTKTLLRLGLYSRQIMHEIEPDLGFDFSYRKVGKFTVFYSNKALEKYIKHAEFMSQHGAPFESLSAAECVKREPSLKNMEAQIVGGIYHKLDETADALQFAQNLAAKLAKEGVTFQYDTTIESIETDDKNITSIQTDKGEVKGDIYVMAMGAYSSIALKKIGIKASIYPLKGYSISVPITNKNPDCAPNISVTISAERTVYTKLGDVMRAVGTAEFAGYDDSITPHRIDLIKSTASQNFPDCDEIDNTTEWACLRPCTPDSLPILGASKYSNLFLNIGHGALGWTQAVGSSKIVSDIIAEKKPDIDMSGLTTDRF